MDAGLLAWGRAVKQRRKNKLPVLWLFTDARRLPDPLPAIAQLPKGLCGVVFRHDGAPGRSELAMRIAALCNKRRLALVVAGDPRLAAAIKAGVHLRGGRGAKPVRSSALVTSSAHDIPELRRARQAGAEIIFLSPAFATSSHPDAAALGAIRWINLARQGRGGKVYSLGGVNGENVNLLTRFCAGVGAIGGLIPRCNHNVI